MLTFKKATKSDLKEILKLLFQDDLGKSRENGCKILQLTTNQARQDALRFYERQGFKVTYFGLKFEV